VTELRQVLAQGTPEEGGETVTELLRIVRTLAEELHPHIRRSQDVNLDSDLDRDLGLDSLGRAELVLRLDKAFKVRLPENLIGDANSPRDLLIAVRAAGPMRVERSAGNRGEATMLPRVEAPSTAETLIEVLDFHTRAHPDRPHLQVWLSEDREDLITYSDLHNGACKVAYGLTKRGLVPGERVAIMLATEAAFFEAFFGTLYAGGIPVPIYPPFRRAQMEDHLRRQAGILRNAEASFLIVGEELRNVGSLLFGLAESLRHIETASGLAKGADAYTPVPARGQTVALIQYTSGSTGDPKGVVLTHANLLANIRSMGQALDAGSTDIFVSWLPLYHDMGLIGAWLGSLYYGARAIIMPPLAFLADPSRWLRAISRHRATLSAAPNFAFELCCKNIRDEDIVGLDLSSLRMIVNGAEPVSTATIGRFTERFAPYGFRPEMMGPVYGLAENSVGLAFPPLGRAPVVDRISRSALSRDGLATPVNADDKTALTFVACGQPIPRHEIRIVDDAGRELPERVEGKLQFRGPSATAGYFRSEEKNRALFAGEWLESGDRAYLASGDVYITGRIKDMIIKAGRHIYPHEIEELVGQIEGVRKGCVAAIAGTDQGTGTERLVLVVETRLSDDTAKELLRQRITEACTVALETPPDVIELVSPHTVPKTSSGKIRRAATRQLYEAGLGPDRERSLWLQLFWLGLSGLGARVRRSWRRAVEIAYAGYWWAVLVMIAVVVWPMVLVLLRRDWRHGVVHVSARMFLRLTGATPEVTNPQRLTERGAVFIANHSSYLDALVITAVVPGPLAFVAKEELARQWVAGPFLKRLGTLFVRRALASGGVEDTEKQKDAARAGERIVTFPEATLTRMPGLLGFQLGAFLVAAQAGLPIIPIALRGTRSILRGEQWFPRSAKIVVHIGEPILPEGSDFAAAIRLRDKSRAVMLEHLGEPDLVRERVSIPAAP
jgi:1-acyl-sn-glycerol-3-phosphate acyltransferase